ncbi:hypothetical protein [Halocynthiibacter sp.]|uniref:hypothetical protein n=1 Tax=Halocynthiibacter sp. TaxID=1979210 RepID=UPI003C6899D9
MPWDTNALAVVSEALNNIPIKDPHLSQLRSAVVGISGAMCVATGEVIAGAYREVTL